MVKKKLNSRFLFCISNVDYPVSLEARKVYRRVRDLRAESHDLVRIIDESGEAYLYPSKFFIPIELPRKAEAVFAGAS